jgi:uncharacterized protein YjiS (DUF1127 family)
MRVTHYQSGETTPRLATARESFGRIGTQRIAPASPIPRSAARPGTATGLALNSSCLETAARAYRARRVGQLVLAAWHGVATAARRVLGAWQRQRERRATYVALSDLDDRTLHDLGFGRGEILSVAMDIDRDGETRRLRSARAANALQLF